MRWDTEIVQYVHIISQICNSFDILTTIEVNIRIGSIRRISRIGPERIEFHPIRVVFFRI